ncbi:MAG: hypothetical protein CSA19_00810, partial [Deltaproteobacteria bacterium]
MSKQRILNSLKDALKSKKRTQKQDIGRSYEHMVKNEATIDEFKRKLVVNKTILLESSPETLVSDIKNLLKEINATKLIYGRSLGLDLGELDIPTLTYTQTSNELGAGLFEYDTSIIHARAGVANMGTFCVTSSPDQPRLLSLTPKNSIVLLKKEDVKNNMNEVFES